jgi:hypothetical protein
VFPTSNGRPHEQSNIRRRLLAPAVKLANDRLEQAGEVPLPAPLTPHNSQRRRQDSNLRPTA